VSDTREVVSRPLSNADIARVLSPLLFFGAHCLYLVIWSTDPFLKKWIDGSFTFFIALVLCNIIRARLTSRGDPHEEDSPEVANCGRIEADGDPEGGDEGRSGG
jgi:hypothetical protein